MRVSLLLATALGAAAVLSACNDARSPTGRPSPRFGVSGNGDSSAQDTTGRPSHYIANGATADVYWSAGGGGDSVGGGGTDWMYGYVSVNRNSQVNDEWTNVNWSVQQCDAFWNCRYSSGYGFAHADLLAGSGGGDLRLDLDPAAYPGSFEMYGDSIGPIQLTWRQAAGYSSRSTGTTVNTYPGYTYHSNGVTVSSAAAVKGHVGRYVLPVGTLGNMGTNHAMTIIFSH